MKEYHFENGHDVDIDKLRAPHMSKSEYSSAHKGLVIPTHDIIICYKGGALLVVRENVPAKGMLFPIGGRIERGLKIEDSLRKKVKEECNLDLESIKELGYVRIFLETDPFGHDKGTDHISFMFFGKGKGELKLDNLHSSPTIVTPEKYTEEFKEKLHPWVKDFMDLAMPLIKQE